MKHEIARPSRVIFLSKYRGVIQLVNLNREITGEESLLRLLYNPRMYRSISFWVRWKYQYPISVHEMSASLSVGGIGMHAPSLPGRDGQPAFMARLQFGHTTHPKSRETPFTQVLALRHAHYSSSVEDTLHALLFMRGDAAICKGSSCRTPSKSQSDISYPRKPRHYSGDQPCCIKKLTTASLQSTPQARRAVNDIPPVFPNSKSDRSQR